MKFLNDDEQRTMEQLSRMPKLSMKAASKQRIRQNLVQLSESQSSASRRRFRGRISGFAAGLGAIAIVTLGYLSVSHHQKPAPSQRTTANRTAPLQAESSDMQTLVNQMTPDQQSKLHQLLTRDTQLADLWIYDGDTNDPALVTQMENDFKTFQALFPQQMVAIKAYPVSVYKETVPSALSPGVDANYLDGYLAEIYLAYQAAIWNMGDPNTNLINPQLVKIVQRPDVPGVFATWNRVFFGGKIDPSSLTQQEQP